MVLNVYAKDPMCKQSLHVLIVELELCRVQWVL